MTAPTLTGFAPSITFDENTVNGTPQLLDADVVFADVDGDFDGGMLTLTGLLAEDRVSVRNEGSGEGQIGLSGANVTFGGVTIGTLAGGAGATLTITFNASATSAAIDALIQNLTYANVSNAPTASRDLILNVTDASGNDLGAGDLAFTQRTGAANPLDGFNVGNLSRPALVDIDNDGDLDAVVGAGDGSLAYFENTGSNAAAVFVQRTGAANPFDGIDVGGAAAPAFADLDNDGDLDVVVGENDTVLNYLENVGTASAPIFVQRTGAANPFDAASPAPITAPSFGDLDGDGDLDAVVGQFGGALSYFENTGTALAPVFAQRAGAANPFDGVSNDGIGAASFADIDGDGDLDAVMGTFSGGLNYFENTGTASVPVFVQRTGNANPFEGFDVGYNSSPVFADVDGDGDLDIVVGDDEGRLFHFENTTVRGQAITVTVTAQNDALAATGLPTDVTVTEDVASNLDLSAVTLGDADLTDTLTVVLTASAGTLTASSGGGVTVSDSGTGALTLTGTAADIDAFLNTASNIQYTGALNANGDNAATVTVTANDGSGAVTLGTVNVDITAVNDAPTLTGFAPSISFAENTVNATPQLLDADVVFTDVEGNFNGGTLTLSGLLAEDTVSVRNEGSGAGQIGLSGANVSFGGVVIGTLAGGSGGTLTITFNASATSEAIGALIQNLTYANVSDTPTASRTLRVNVTDAAGEDLLATTFSQQDASNPFAGMGFGNRAAATFGDLNGDGDADAIVGVPGQGLRYLENTGSAQTPVFEQRTGMDVPFGDIPGDQAPAPVLVDVDTDGDLDLVLGNNIGMIQYFENTGTAGAAAFTERTGAANPFDAIDESFRNSPAFGDVDGDGDLDLVVGEADGGFLNYFENTGSAGAPVFVQRTGAANPFNGLNVGGNSNPFLIDIDGDGDLDAVVGQSNGSLTFLENTGTAGAPTFVAGTGAANPFNGVNVGNESMPTFADLDGDGDLDAMVGNYLSYAYSYGGGFFVQGQLTFFQNQSPPIPDIIVNVTAEADASANADILSGTIGADSLDGLGGDDILSGGAGDDTLDGNTGNDTADYSAAASGVRAQLNDTIAATDGDGGFDTLISIENLTGSAFNDLLIGSDGVNVLTGGLGTDILLGLGGNDILIGGTGAGNTLQGGLGDDTYVISQNDTVTEFADQGTDTIQTDLASYVLRSHFENLTYTGSGAFVAGGNSVANVMTGAAMNDILQGLAGDDTLIGRGGYDILNGAEGSDTASYATAAAAVSVRLAINVTLNDGDGSSDRLAGIENVIGSAFNDLIFGDANGNVLNGGLGADTLLGFDGNDTLIGGLGASNTVQGGMGDDTYVVSANDTILELADQGIDTVQTDRAFLTLRANVENLTYTGSGVFQGMGNELNNVITGGAQNDTLIGGLGNDTLNGGAGTADYIVLQGVQADYTVTDLGGGSYQIVDSVGGRDGTDTTTGIERVLFASGPTASLASLVVTPGAPPEPVDKTGGAAQVLPGLGADDFLPLAKGGDLPLVLPGSGDPFADLFGGLERLSLDQGSDSPWQMLTLDPEATPGNPADGLIGARDHSGWNHDTWLS